MIPIQNREHALARAERTVLGLGIEILILGISEGSIVPDMRDRAARTGDAEMVHRSDTADRTGLVGVDPECVLGYGAGVCRRVSEWFTVEADMAGSTRPNSTRLDSTRLNSARLTRRQVDHLGDGTALCSESEVATRRAVPLGQERTVGRSIGMVRFITLKAPGHGLCMGVPSAYSPWTEKNTSYESTCELRIGG